MDSQKYNQNLKRQTTGCGDQWQSLAHVRPGFEPQHNKKEK